MKPENKRERNKRFLLFGGLSVAGIVLLIIISSLLTDKQFDTQPSSFQDVSSPESGMYQEKADSIEKENLVIRSRLAAKDSLIAAFESQQTREIDTAAMAKLVKDNPANGQELEKLQKQIAFDEQQVTILQGEKARMQEQLAASGNDQKTLADQLAVQRSTIESLQAHLADANHAGQAPDRTNTATEDQRIDPDVHTTALASKNEALEKQTEELTDQLRFAEVDCNLSRADARQIVYNAKQRQGLLTDALTALNELAKSRDPEVRKKAKEKLDVLRNLAGMVHD